MEGWQAGNTLNSGEVTDFWAMYRIPPSTSSTFSKLNGDGAEVDKAFRESTRRNINKAEREGVDIRFGHTREYLKIFYGLHCQTRKHHGLPPQPWSFFEKIHEHILAPEKGHVILAVYQGRPVAGAVFFHFRSGSVFKYGASDRTFQHLRPNNLIMWREIEFMLRQRL